MQQRLLSKGALSGLICERASLWERDSSVGGEKGRGEGSRMGRVEGGVGERQGDGQGRQSVGNCIPTSLGFWIPDGGSCEGGVHLSLSGIGSQRCLMNRLDQILDDEAGLPLWLPVEPCVVSSKHGME